MQQKIIANRSSNVFNVSYDTYTVSVGYELMDDKWSVIFAASFIFCRNLIDILRLPVDEKGYLLHDYP